MKSLNKVLLIGNLGKDPELRYAPNGTPVLRFSLATSFTWRDEKGQNQEKTDWHNIVLWGKLGETISQYLHKGSKVYVEGRITTRKWQDQHGVDKYTTEIMASNIMLLTPKSAGENVDYSEQFIDNSAENFDDDIPF